MEILKFIVLGCLLPIFFLLMGGLFLTICLLLFCKESIDSIYDRLYKDFIP